MVLGVVLSAGIGFISAYSRALWLGLCFFSVLRDIWLPLLLLHIQHFPNWVSFSKDVLRGFLLQFDDDGGDEYFDDDFDDDNDIIRQVHNPTWILTVHESTY